MSVEQESNGVQRQGHDIADRFSSLAQSVGCLLQNLRSSGGPSPQPPVNDHLPPPASHFFRSEETRLPWQWPWLFKPRSRTRGRFDRVQLNGRRRTAEELPPDDGRSAKSTAIHELGRRLSQAGADLGASFGGFVAQFTKNLAPRDQEEVDFRVASPPNADITMEYQGDYMDWRDVNRAATAASTERATTWKRVGIGRQSKVNESWPPQEGETQEFSNEELFAVFTKRQGRLHRQGSVSVITTYDSRTQEVESSVTARGDLWRAQASHGGSSSANGHSPLFLLQIGPILFVRDTTLLLPIHLSKQHLLWYGFDRKNGVHSICPAVWSKHRRWLLMSMICLSPLACSFLDLQFPNGQLTYVAEEGFTGNAFYPCLGGILQAQIQHPGVAKLSSSWKMSWGTSLSPSLLLPEKSFSLDVVQPVAWQRSGIMLRPTVQLRVMPTIGGRNAGWRAELVHSPKEKISWACGCALTVQPTIYASISLGKSKCNGNDSGSSGLVLLVEAPTENVSRASFCIQLNSSVEF